MALKEKCEDIESLLPTIQSYAQLIDQALREPITPVGSFDKI